MFSGLPSFPIFIVCKIAADNILDLPFTIMIDKVLYIDNHQPYSGVGTIQDELGVKGTVSLTPKFEKGDNVCIISSGKVGTVNEVLLRQSGVGYRVTVDGRVSAYQEKFLEPYMDEEQSIIEMMQLNDFKGPRDFQLFQTWYRLKRPIEGNFYSYLASRTIFNPYQFKPLSKFISAGSEGRLFIADEVGVGKTIETGIILTELIARGHLDRRSPILIVCPNALGYKWKKEMKDRFNLSFEYHSGRSIRSALKLALATGSLPEYSSWAIVSLQALRMEENLNLLREIDASREVPLWSIIIIDEAHHMRNSGTASNALGNTLSGLTDMFLMLSATPLNLKDEDLFHQMQILNPAFFPDYQTFEAMLSPVKAINKCRRLLAEKNRTVYGNILREIKYMMTGPLGKSISSHPSVAEMKENLSRGAILSNSDIARYDRMLMSLSPLDNSFTRTLKKEALEHRVTREALKIPVKLTTEEMAFYLSVVELAKKTYLERGYEPVALGFITNMLRRMVSSCIPAMHLYLDWCIANDQLLIEKLEAEEEPDDDADYVVAPLRPELRAEYVRLSVQARKLGDQDSKYIEFEKVLQQMLENLDNPQVMVFSFFVRTLKYLQKRLVKEGYRVGLICGEVPLISDGNVPGRKEIMEAFEKKELDVLLSSEVGGEGLDFQFCQAIINYDLPYNPMRVEQRIGRIDRFGQTSDKVLVSSMYLEDTVDERIYSALYERINLIEDSVGSLEPILGTTLTNLQKEIISGKLTEEQLEVRMKEVQLAIEQAKLEMEKFEANRKELMGDEYFTKPIHNLVDQAEFVQPTDATGLTSICLANWIGCRYEQVKDDMGLLTLSKEIISRIEQYTRRPGSEGSISELEPLLSGKKRIPVVFNGTLANTHRDYHFLPPCGFWIKFLIKEMESANEIGRVFALQSQDHNINTLLGQGVFLIALFEVKIEGFRVELDMASVPIHLGKRQVVDCNFSQLTKLIGKAVSTNSTIGFQLNDYCIKDPEVLVDRSRESLEKQMNKKVSILTTENRYRINARIDSLRKGSEVRVNRLIQKIEEHSQRSFAKGKKPSGDFIRLTEAQIAMEERRIEEKINELQARRELSLTLSLISIIMMEV